MLHHTQYVHAGAKGNIVRDETKSGKISEIITYSRLSGSNPFFSTTASSRSGCSRCSTGLFNQVAGSWVSSLQSYHSKLAAVLVSSNAMLPVVGSLVFPWPQIQVGQRDLQTGTKAKQKPVLCAKGTTKHNPGIRKRWALLNFASKKVASGVDIDIDIDTYR